ncbi:aggregation factor core [uncultured Ruegeria sp.]|uniref:aggregation factor core n=1 Tax=uncultured Ruegeria sp. TaxID=259304 RepID=UPI0026168BDD|nr:aggregation factor core [uncultured Ruegeria sp.]
MLRLFILATAIGFVLAGPLQAGIQVRFIEGAPKDQFVFKNLGSCDLEASILSLDLAGSSGRLIFDVSGTGAGVEVFQPFELIDGADALRELPSVVDGQTSVELQIVSLKVGDIIAFTIDVDDTIGQREITVSGTEIVGAQVFYEKDGQSSAAVFSSEAQTMVTIPDC